MLPVYTRGLVTSHTLRCASSRGWGLEGSSRMAQGPPPEGLRLVQWVRWLRFPAGSCWLLLAPCFMLTFLFPQSRTQVRGLGALWPLPSSAVQLPHFQKCPAACSWAGSGLVTLNNVSIGGFTGGLVHVYCKFRGAGTLPVSFTPKCLELERQMLKKRV